MVALAGDRFVIRDETNVRTLGGGVVLNPLGRRIRKPLELYLKHLGTLGGPLGPAAVESMLGLHDSLAMPPARLAQLFNTPLIEVEGCAQGLAFYPALAWR